MANEIKQEAQEVITAFKGFDSNMQCRGYQFEVGKTYEHPGKVKACESGFHSCENPLDVLNYYSLIGETCEMNRFASVKAFGEISRHGEDSKIASAKISIEAELKLPEIVSAAIKWISSCASKDDTASGDYSKNAQSGNNSQNAQSGNNSQNAQSGGYSKNAQSGYNSKNAQSGYNSKNAQSGNNSKNAQSGNNSKNAQSGDYSQNAQSGDYSKNAQSGKSCISASVGLNSIASTGDLGCIALTRWVESENRYRMSVAYVGENGIKPNVFYKLDDEGNFVEA